jgi:hypothetical protein
LEAGDIDGDGATEVLYVDEDPEGGANLIAKDLKGVIRWQHGFPGFNGYVAEWGDGMTTFWALGHFLNKGHVDIFVSNRRSTMHSDESSVIDIQKNKAVWNKDTLDIREPWTDASKHTRGYGGSLPAIADFDSNGLDDIALTYPCELSVVRGRGRQPALRRELRSRSGHEAVQNDGLGRRLADRRKTHGSGPGRRRSQRVSGDAHRNDTDL